MLIEPEKNHTTIAVCKRLNISELRGKSVIFVHLIFWRQARTNSWPRDCWPYRGSQKIRSVNRL